MKDVLPMSPEYDAPAQLKSLYRYFVNFPDMLFLKDGEGRIVMCNKLFASLCRETPEKLVGKKVSELGLPVVLSGFMENSCRATRQSGKPVNVHQWFENAQGESLCYNLQTFPDKDAGGRGAYGVFGALRDVTALRTVERTLREQGDLLQTANDAALVLLSDEEDMDNLAWLSLRLVGRAVGADCVGVWRNHHDQSTGLECTLVYSWSNESWPLSSGRFDGTLAYGEHLPGWQKALSRGESVNLPGRSATALPAFFEAKGAGSLFAVPILTRTAFWGFICLVNREYNKSRGTDEENLLRSVGLLLASSIQRRSMQKALRDSEERFRDVAEAAGEIVWELDAAGKFSYVSERMLSLTGFSPTEITGASWDDISLDTEEEPISKRMFEAGIPDGSFRGLRHNVVAKAGQALWLSSSGKILTGFDGIAGLRGVSLDITQERKNSEDLITAMKALERANTDLSVSARQAHELAKKAEEANRAKSDFLANISHEIRTPLNAIIGMSYLIKKTDLTTLQTDYADKIHSGGMALLGVVDEVLDFAKIESGNIVLEQEPFSLADVVNLLSSVIGEKVEKKGLDAALVIDPDVPMHLVGDSVRLGQILMNLLGNAAKFTEKGGLGLRCSLEKMGGGKASIRFVISDTGIGIEKERKGQLFEPFWQAEASITRRYGGTGLGLSIVKKLVGIKDGSINIESEPGRGTTVTLVLTYALDARRGEAPASRSGSLSGVRAVVVDPSELQRGYLEEALAKAGCRVNAVDSMASGFAALQGSDNATANARIFIVPLAEVEQNKDLKHLAEMRLRNMPHVICITPFGLGKTTEELAKLLDYPVAGQTHRPITSPALMRTIRIALGSTGADGDDSDTSLSLAAPYFPGSRILLVEDNPVNQQIALELLKETGAVVTVAANGREALARMTDEENHFDLVFMDLQMPVMDGFEATAKIRENPAWADLPIIAMTAHATVDEREQTLASGMNEHIAKPIDIAALYDALRRWLKAPELSSGPGEDANAPLAGEGADKGEHKVDIAPLLGQLENLNYLLAEDDAASCRLFGELKAQLEAVDMHATSVAAQALAEFDFAEALSVLRPMEIGLKNTLRNK